DRFEELLNVLVLAGDADQLGQVLESTLRLQRPRGLEFCRVAGAVENRLEDDARAVVDGPKIIEEIDELAAAGEGANVHARLLGVVQRLVEGGAVRRRARVDATERRVA